MENALKMVRERVAESIGIQEDEVNAKSQFRELVDDSLELANLCLDLEDLTGIDADEIADIDSVGALAARLNDSDSNTARLGRRN